MRAEGAVMRYPERVRDRSWTGDGWKIVFGLLTFCASAGTGLWLFMNDVDHDVDNYESGTAAGNSVWMLGLVAIVALVYVLWIVFRDVEEVIEHEVHDHLDDLQHLESFEPTLFHWALGVAVIVVLIALLL